MAYRKTEEKKDRWFLRHLAVYAASVLALVIVSSVFLRIVTNHNKIMSVPDFSGMTAGEAAAAASAAGLRTVVHDSLYQKGLKPGVVFEQDPKAGAGVKKGRRIQLRINTMVAKKVPMPSLVGCSTRQARAELVRTGLILGKLVYVRDIATNNVIRQMLRGREVSAGKLVPSGSVIDLVVGLSSTENQTYIPDLVGRDFGRAADLLHDNSLNVGRVRGDSRIKTYSDTLRAVVISQNPSASSGLVTMGTAVSLTLSSDPEKIEAVRKK